MTRFPARDPILMDVPLESAVGPVLLPRSRNQIFPFPPRTRQGNNTASFWPLAEPEHFDNLRNCLEPKDFLKRARSLMVVVSTPPTQNYEEFTKKVREYSSKEPFNFIIPELLRKYEKVALFLSDIVQCSLRNTRICMNSTN